MLPWKRVIRPLAAFLLAAVAATTLRVHAPTHSCALCPVGHLSPKLLTCSTTYAIRPFPASRTSWRNRRDPDGSGKRAPDP